MAGFMQEAYVQGRVLISSGGLIGGVICVLGKRWDYLWGWGRSLYVGKIRYATTVKCKTIFYKVFYFL